MKTIIYKLHFVVFLILLIIPFITSDFSKNVISEIDNKELEKMPQLFSEGFTDNYENYLEDRIGGRNWMIKMYGIINDYTVNELAHPSYTYGKAGYVFFNMHDNITYNDYHSLFAETVLKLQNYCESRGAKFYFIFDPEKISVYRKYLPEGVNYNDEWVDTLFSYMDHLGIKCVNSSEVLKEKANDQQVFNKVYDAGHWNDIGCYYATNCLLEKIHEDFSNVNVLTEDMFNITYEEKTTLPNSEFAIKEYVPVYQSKANIIDVTDKWDDEVYRNPQFPYFNYKINTGEEAEELPRALVFQGSYYNRAPQFISTQMSETVGIHNYQNIFNIEYYFNIFQPDIVILDAAEYVFSDYYFSKDTMNSINLNPSIHDCINEDVNTNLSFEDVPVLPIKANAFVFRNNKIDDIKIDLKLDDVKYAYLSVGDNIYDLILDKRGLYCASIFSGIIPDDKKGMIIVKREDETIVQMQYESDIMTGMPDEVEYSKGVFWNNESNKTNFFTKVDDNEFNFVTLQLVDFENKSYLDNIDSFYYPENIKKSYTHTKKSGWYFIRLKANSNKADEYVDYIVYLKKGNTYTYSFDIDKLSKKEVLISNFVFGDNTL